MNKIRKYLAIPLLGIMMLCMTQSSFVKADQVCMIKAPIDAKVIVKGVALSDTDAVKINSKSGRIHELAVQNLGITSGYKQFIVNYFVNPSDVQVFDRNMMVLEPSRAEAGLIEYLSDDPVFEATVSDRVRNTAIAFHNRVGGYGGSNFGSYFLQGSDAYIKIAASDQGRKWGQPMRAGVIANVDVTEITKYSDQAFTARVTVHATNGSGFDEIYNISFLFQHTGKDFYATHFTYMP